MESDVEELYDLIISEDIEEVSNLLKIKQKESKHIPCSKETTKALNKLAQRSKYKSKTGRNYFHLGTNGKH